MVICPSSIGWKTTSSGCRIRSSGRRGLSYSSKTTQPASPCCSCGASSVALATSSFNCAMWPALSSGHAARHRGLAGACHHELPWDGHRLPHLGENAVDVQCVHRVHHRPHGFFALVSEAPRLSARRHHGTQPGAKFSPPCGQKARNMNAGTGGKIRQRHNTSITCRAITCLHGVIVM